MAAQRILSGASGIVATGSGTAPARYFGADSAGTTTINATAGPTGGPAYVFAAAATVPFLSVEAMPDASTQTNAMFRCKFKVSDATPSANTAIVSIVPNGGSQCRIELTTGGVLRALFGTATAPQNGPTLSDDTWYELEVQADVSSGTRSIRWRTADVATNTWTDQTGTTTAVAASTAYAVWFGEVAGPTSGITITMTDIVIGFDTDTSVDWLAAGETRNVGVLRPDSDGTHSFTAGDFKDTAGTNIATNATTAYQLVDDADQTSLADFIQQAVIRADGYVEVGFGSASSVLPLAVGVTSTHHSSSTSANQMGVRATDDGGSNVTTLWNANDVSDTTAHWRQAVMTTKPSGGAWTLAALNALMVRLGYSGDVTDIPYFDSVSLEYAYTPVEAAAASGLMGLLGIG